MPKRYARIWREITGVRPELLLDGMTDEEAVLEGVEVWLRRHPEYQGYDLRSCYFLWFDELHGLGTSKENLWLWRIEYKEVER